jgi:hypothetical protein
MLSRFARHGLVCLILFLVGCARYQDMSRVDVAWLQAHSGQNVKLNGCLVFTCITAPGAQYPRDCVAAINNQAGTSSIGLEFSADKTDLRTRINEYYPGIGRGCRPFGVTGVLNEHRCVESDTGCTSSYGLAVTAVEFFNP